MDKAPGAASTDLGTMERETIAQVLTDCRWNKTRAANRLGLTRTSSACVCRSMKLKSRQGDRADGFTARSKPLHTVQRGPPVPGPARAPWRCAMKALGSLSRFGKGPKDA